MNSPKMAQIGTVSRFQAWKLGAITGKILVVRHLCQRHRLAHRQDASPSHPVLLELAAQARIGTNRTAPQTGDWHAPRSNIVRRSARKSRPRLSDDETVRCE